MSCTNLDRDQTFIVQDFGPKGHIKNVNVNLTHGFQPGATFSAVILTDHQVFINIYDADRSNLILHVAGRLSKFSFNSKLGDTWGSDEPLAVNPLIKEIRASISIVYEEAGYRIFVNGKEEKFFKHRTTIRPDNVDIADAQIFKIVYHTTMDIVP